MSLGTFVLRDLNAERSCTKVISNDCLLVSKNVLYFETEGVFDMNICLPDRKYLVIRSEIMAPLAYTMSFINNNSRKITS